MKIGLCSVTFKDKTPEEVIEIAKEANLDGVEWSERDHVPSDNLEYARKVKELCDEADLNISSYGSYYAVGSNGDFQKIIDAANALETKTIRVWAGSKGSAESSDTERDEVYKDASRIASLAAKDNITINFEYHLNTLTDTVESAESLMNNIEESNVHLYWQPNEKLRPKERVESLDILGKYITNVHVFNWDDPFNRYPLAAANEDWSKYINVLEKTKDNNFERYYLLEFIKDDSDEQFIEDAKTLKNLIQ